MRQITEYWIKTTLSPQLFSGNLNLSLDEPYQTSLNWQCLSRPTLATGWMGFCVVFQSFYHVIACHFTARTLPYTLAHTYQFSLLFAKGSTSSHIAMNLRVFLDFISHLYIHSNVSTILFTSLYTIDMGGRWTVLWLFWSVRHWR